MMKKLQKKLYSNQIKSRRELEEEAVKSSKKELVIESLKLPKDSLLGASIITLTGNTEAFIENYKGIMEYSTEQILLQGKTCKIELKGKRLSIVYYTNEDMKINGWIENVRYFM